MLLVHIAGTADLGVPLKKGNRNRAQEDIEDDLRFRLAELNSQRKPSDISSRLLELNFDHQIDIDTDEEDASTPPGSSLKKRDTSPVGTRHQRRQPGRYSYHRRRRGTHPHRPARTLTRSSAQRDF